MTYNRITHAHNTLSPNLLPDTSLQFQAVQYLHHTSLYTPVHYPHYTSLHTPFHYPQYTSLHTPVHYPH